MQAPLAKADSHDAESALDASDSVIPGHSEHENRDLNSFAQAGRALAGVFVAGLILWAGVILAIRAVL